MIKNLLCIQKFPQHVYLKGSVGDVKDLCPRSYQVTAILRPPVSILIEPIGTLEILRMLIECPQKMATIRIDANHKMIAKGY